LPSATGDRNATRWRCGDDDDYQGDGNLDAEELRRCQITSRGMESGSAKIKGMTDYEIVCETLKAVMFDPPAFVREIQGLIMEVKTQGHWSI